MITIHIWISRRLAQIFVLLLYLILAALLVMNHYTLPPFHEVQTNKMGAALCTVFIPILILSTLWSNRKIAKGSSPGQGLMDLEAATRYMGWIGIAGLIAGFAIPAIWPARASAFLLAAISLGVLLLVCVIRLFLAATFDPFCRAQDSTPETTERSQDK